MSAPSSSRFVVRLRGLPWDTTPEQIEMFLGLDRSAKVFLLPGPGGRSSGEALVEVDSNPAFQGCLAKDKSHLGKRYVEVYPSTSAQLDRERGMIEKPNVPASATSFVVRLLGVPFSATLEAIENFFEHLVPVAVHIPKDYLGRPSGEAYIEFASEPDGRSAMKSHRKIMGNRYIEIFQSTHQELCMKMGVPVPGSHESVVNRTCIRVQGLPYKCRDEQIVMFFQSGGVTPSIIHRSEDGSSAFVEFETHEEAITALRLHGKYIGHRYVELFLVDKNTAHRTVLAPISPFECPHLQWYESQQGQFSNYRG